MYVCDASCRSETELDVEYVKPTIMCSYNGPDSIMCIFVDEVSVSPANEMMASPPYSLAGAEDWTATDLIPVICDAAWVA